MRTNYITTFIGKKYHHYAHVSLFRFLPELKNSMHVYIMKYTGADGATIASMARSEGRNMGFIVHKMVQNLHSRVPKKNFSCILYPMEKTNCLRGKPLDILGSAL